MQVSTEAKTRKFSSVETLHYVIMKLLSLKMKLVKKIGFFIVALSLLVACDDARPQLEQIQARGELHVVSRYGLTSYYVKGDALSGFEYELAEKFAQRLNVKLKITVPESLGQMLEMIETGQADIAAAGLTKTPAREQQIQFGPVYHEVSQQVIYRHGSRRPADISALSDGQLEVVGNSSHVENLKMLKNDFPTLQWIENHELDNSGLMELVQLEMIDFTVADSNEMAANQTLFPELRVAFELSDPQPLAWGLRRNDDTSLYDEVVSFFEDIESSGYLGQLIEGYYGYIRRFDYVDTRTIHRRILTHLPQYQGLLMEAAKEYGFDWRLLAAVSYQESHWNPNAVSATGVRGLMMLTQATASEMGVIDREDPVQSIMAGTAYLKNMKERLPEEINEPDLTWLALAAYNVGLGHLEDARMLTEMNGGNPNSWTDVRDTLPLLAKPKWYEQTRFGYARGGEPARYVDNIRRYYDIILHSQNVSPFQIEPLLPLQPELLSLPEAL